MAHLRRPTTDNDRCDRKLFVRNCAIRYLADAIKAQFRRYFLFDEKRLEGEEAKFYHSWLERNDASVALFGAIASALFHAITLVTDYLVMWERFYTFMWKVHALNLIAIMLFFVFRRTMTKGFRLALVASELLTISFYWYILFDVLELNPGIDLHVVKAWTGFLTLSVFTILMVPFHNFIPAAYTLALTVMAGYAWRIADGGGEIMSIAVLALAGALAFHRGLSTSVKRKAVHEYATREQLKRAEHEKMERELVLARDIQDSYAPPPSFHFGSYDVSCIQRKNAKVGGDWAAIRQTESGEVVVLVADATGKGMQAALVVHAVQSLWAEALEKSVFDPRDWMQRVNKALYRLGRNKPHSMTMGILVVSDLKVTYWSAGHLPLYMITEHGIKEQANVVLAGGDILGINEDIRLGSRQVMIDPARPVSLLVGTDGVFAKGTRYSHPEILSFHSHVLVDCARALELCGADDDKTLVWVKRRANVAAA